VPLTASERILVLSDVAQGLAFLHSEVKVIHRDFTSASVVLDRNCVGRISKKTNSQNVWPRINSN